MPAYLISGRGNPAFIQFSNQINNEAKRLSECSDLELEGLSVYNEGKEIDTWPAQDQPLSQALIAIISLQLRFDNDEALHQHINNTIYPDNDRLIPHFQFSTERCPFTSWPINQTRLLGMTIIPSDEFLKKLTQKETYTHESFIELYFNNAQRAHELLPDNSLPFALIDFPSYSLAMCETLDRRSPLIIDPTNDDEIKINFIDPFLHVIKQLHDHQLTHGDFRCNHIVSTKFKKLMLFDFKHLGDTSYGSENWDFMRLTDFQQTAESISDFVRYFGDKYDKNPAIVYLRMLENKFSNMCYNSEKLSRKHLKYLIDANKHLTIDVIIEHVNQFWTLPYNDIVYFDIEYEEISLLDMFPDSNNEPAKQLPSEHINTIRQAYSEALQNSNEALVSFYEEIYPEYTFQFGRILKEDFTVSLREYQYSMFRQNELFISSQTSNKRQKLGN